MKVNGPRLDHTQRWVLTFFFNTVRPSCGILYIEIFLSNFRDTKRNPAFEPPIVPGRIEPVSWYRVKILETQPWLTRSCREISHGRIPYFANSTI